MYGLRKKSNYFIEKNEIVTPLAYIPAYSSNEIKINTHANLRISPMILSDWKNMFYAVSVNDETKKVFAVYENYVTSEKTYTDLVELTHLGLAINSRDDIAKFKKVIIYDRALSKEELIILRDKVMKCMFDKFYNLSTFVNGTTGLGCSSAYKMRSLDVLPTLIDTPVSSGEHTIESNGETITFINIDPTEPTVEDDLSYVEELIWLNPIESLNVGDMYNIEAMVYPYDVTTNPGGSI